MISVICYHLERHAWYFPTDNLYKFLALVGTVIVILSIYFTETRVAEVGDTIINVEEVQNISKARYEALKIKLGQLKEIIDNSIAEQTGKKKAVGKLEVRYSETEIKALHRQVQDLIGEQGIEMVKVNTSMKRLEKLNERSKRIFTQQSEIKTTPVGWISVAHPPSPRWWMRYAYPPYQYGVAPSVALISDCAVIGTFYSLPLGL